MNSYELGAALSLNFPRLVLPWIKNRVDPFRFPSETNFKIYAEQVNRARYFKMLSFGGTVSYSFQPKRSIKHTVTPIHLAFNTLQHRTARFDSIANANPVLFHSLDDQFIPSLTYTVTYDNSYRKKKNRVWWGKFAHLSRKCDIRHLCGFWTEIQQKGEGTVGKSICTIPEIFFRSKIYLPHQ